MAKFNEYNGGGWTQEGGAGGNGSSISFDPPSGSYLYMNGNRRYTSDNVVSTWYGYDDKVKAEMDELKKEIVRLNKKLNDFIDNPEKAKKQREIDPYGEEDWD